MYSTLLGPGAWAGGGLRGGSFILLPRADTWGVHCSGGTPKNQKGSPNMQDQPESTPLGFEPNVRWKCWNLGSQIITLEPLSNRVSAPESPLNHFEQCLLEFQPYLLTIQNSCEFILLAFVGFQKYMYWASQKLVFQCCRLFLGIKLMTCQIHTGLTQLELT